MCIYYWLQQWDKFGILGLSDPSIEGIFIVDGIFGSSHETGTF